MTVGTYANVVLFQDRTSHASFNVSGNGLVNVSGSIYAPGATLNASGNGYVNVQNTATVGLILSDLTVSGNGYVDPPGPGKASGSEGPADPTAHAPAIDNMAAFSALILERFVSRFFPEGANLLPSGSSFDLAAREAALGKLLAEWSPGEDSLPAWLDSPVPAAGDGTRGGAAGPGGGDELDRVFATVSDWLDSWGVG
jgi:hypothetical protein